MEEKKEDGLLSESIHNNEQLGRATEETVQRIQGVSEGTTTPGEVITKAVANINVATDANKNSLQELAEEYKQLSEVISAVLNEISKNIALTRDLLQSDSESDEKKSYDDFVKLADYEKLFTQIDDLTVSEMIRLRNNLESEWRNLQLEPEQFEKVKKKIDEATKEINDKNPFLALSDAVKGYLSDERKVRPKELAKTLVASFNTVKGSLDEVANAMPTRNANEKINKEFVGDISKMVGSAGDIAAGIASGNFSQVLQSSIKFLSSTIKVFNNHDRKADREIAKHAEAVKDLESKYGELERAMDKALGSGKYKATQDVVKNLEEQYQAITKQAELEESKRKKRDDDKVREYKKSAQDIKSKQIELINKLRSDIMGTDARSAAQELGNAFIEAFGKGEGAVEAFGKKVDDVVANIIKNMLIQKLLEEPVGKILDRYSQKWYDDQGNFSGFDNVMSDANQMGKELKRIGPDFAEAMEKLPDDIKKYFVGPEDSSGSGSLAGAIKGASEETMNMAAGQINAMRINQLEVKEMMRNQLMDHLSTISDNTSYNKYLQSIDRRLESMMSKDSLRAQGLS